MQLFCFSKMLFCMYIFFCPVDINLFPWLQSEKLLTKNLPHPYTSKEVYEQSIRMPIGPDYNPAISVRALNRPAVSIISWFAMLAYLGSQL